MNHWKLKGRRVRRPYGTLWRPQGQRGLKGVSKGIWLKSLKWSLVVASEVPWRWMTEARNLAHFGHDSSGTCNSHDSITVVIIPLMGLYVVHRLSLRQMLILPLEMSRTTSFKLQRVSSVHVLSYMSLGHSKLIHLIRFGCCKQSVIWFGSNINTSNIALFIIRLKNKISIQPALLQWFLLGCCRALHHFWSSAATCSWGSLKFCSTLSRAPIWAAICSLTVLPSSNALTWTHAVEKPSNLHIYARGNKRQIKMRQS